MNIIKYGLIIFITTIILNPIANSYEIEGLKASSYFKKGEDELNKKIIKKHLVLFL